MLNIWEKMKARELPFLKVNFFLIWFILKGPPEEKEPNLEFHISGF